MNGRVYDPVLGRFLSADPLIAQSYDPQNLNRYSYVRNNPLGYVDRNGFSGAPASVLPALEYFSYRQFQYYMRSNISFGDFRSATQFIFGPAHNDYGDFTYSMGLLVPGKKSLRGSAANPSGLESFRNRGYAILAQIPRHPLIQY